MAEKMSNNAAPDSWDETDVADAADLQAKLVKLNVNAVEFVPSFSSFSDDKAAGADVGGQTVDGDQQKDGTDDKPSTSKCSLAAGFKIMTCRS